MNDAEKRIKELDHELRVAKEWWFENKDNLPNEVNHIFFSGVHEQKQRRDKWKELKEHSTTRSRFEQTSI